MERRDTIFRLEASRGDNKQPYGLMPIEPLEPKLTLESAKKQWLECVKNLVYPCLKIDLTFEDVIHAKILSFLYSLLLFPLKCACKDSTCPCAVKRHKLVVFYQIYYWQVLEHGAATTLSAITPEDKTLYFSQQKRLFIKNMLGIKAAQYNEILADMLMFEPLPFWEQKLRDLFQPSNKKGLHNILQMVLKYLAEIHTEGFNTQKGISRRSIVRYLDDHRDKIGVGNEYDINASWSMYKGLWAIITACGLFYQCELNIFREFKALMCVSLFIQEELLTIKAHPRAKTKTLFQQEEFFYLINNAQMYQQGKQFFHKCKETISRKTKGFTVEKNKSTITLP